MPKVITNEQLRELITLHVKKEPLELLAALLLILSDPDGEVKSPLSTLTDAQKEAVYKTTKEVLNISIRKLIASLGEMPQGKTNKLSFNVDELLEPIKRNDISLLN